MRKIYLLISTLIISIALSSCAKEEFMLDENIINLGGAKPRDTELEKWLKKTYIEPYNIKVHYLWNTGSQTSTAQLVPIHEVLVKPTMEMISNVWFAPYEKAASDLFLKQMTPKEIWLVGSPEYNEDGTVKLGQAEGAKKITLYDCNAFNPGNEEWVKSIMHTIEHEFAHIMHQTKSYGDVYKTISAGFYNPTGWYNVDEVSALLYGFISPYSMSGVDEDFVEMISRIMVYGPEWYQYRLDFLLELSKLPPVENESAEQMEERIALMTQAMTGYKALKRKEQIVVDYLKGWKIRFYDEGPENPGLVSLVQDAIAKIVEDNKIQ